MSRYLLFPRVAAEATRDLIRDSLSISGIMFNDPVLR